MADEKKKTIVAEFVTRGIQQMLGGVKDVAKVFAFLSSDLGKATRVIGAAVGKFAALGVALVGLIGTIWLAKKAFDALWGVMVSLKDAVIDLATETKRLMLEYAKFEKVAASAAAILQTQLDTVVEASKAGTTLGISMADSAKGLEEFGRAGFKAHDALKAYTPIAMFARVAQTNLNRATTLVTGAMKSFGFTSEDVWRITSGFTNAIVESRMSFETLETAFGFAGAAGAAFGQTFEQVLAAVMAFRNLGLQASTSGTVFRRTLTRLAKPTKRAREAIHALGMSIQDVAVGPDNTFAQIIRRFAQVDTSSKKMTDSLLSIVGPRFGAYIATLVQATKRGIISLEDMANKTAMSGNVMADFFQFTMNTFSGQLDIARTQIDLLAKSFSQALAPTVRDILHIFNVVTKQLIDYLGIQKDVNDVVEEGVDKLRNSLDPEFFSKALKKFKDDVLDTLKTITTAYESFSNFIRTSDMFTFFDAGIDTMSDLMKIAAGVTAVIATVVFEMMKLGSLVIKVSRLWTKSWDTIISLGDSILSSVHRLGQAYALLRKGELSKFRDLLSKPESIINIDPTLDALDALQREFNEDTAFDDLKKSAGNALQGIVNASIKVMQSDVPKSMREGLDRADNEITKGLKDLAETIKNNNPLSKAMEEAADAGWNSMHRAFLENFETFDPQTDFKLETPKFDLPESVGSLFDAPSTASFQSNFDKLTNSMQNTGKAAEGLKLETSEFDTTLKHVNETVERFRLKDKTEEAIKAEQEANKAWRAAMEFRRKDQQDEEDRKDIRRKNAIDGVKEFTDKWVNSHNLRIEKLDQEAEKYEQMRSLLLQAAGTDDITEDQRRQIFEHMEATKEEMAVVYEELSMHTNNFQTAFNASMTAMTLQFKSAAQIWAGVSKNAFNIIQNGMANTIKSVILGGTSIKKVWKTAAKDMAASIIDAFIKIQIQQLLTSIFGVKVKKNENRTMMTMHRSAAMSGAYAWGAAIGGPMFGRLVAGIAAADVSAMIGASEAISASQAIAEGTGGGAGGGNAGGFATGSTMAGVGEGPFRRDSVTGRFDPDEIILNRSASEMFREVAAGGTAGGGVNVTFKVYATDASSFDEMFDKKIKPRIINALNTDAEFRRANHQSIEDL